MSDLDTWLIVALVVQTILMVCAMASAFLAASKVGEIEDEANLRVEKAAASSERKPKEAVVRMAFRQSQDESEEKPYYEDFCPDCGEDLGKFGNPNFCPKCGARIAYRAREDDDEV